MGDSDFPYRATLENAVVGLGHSRIQVLHNSTEIQEKLSNDAFDVVFFPGGSGSRQAVGLGVQGLAKVKAFVSNGGGFIGTCGGAFLGLEHLRLYGDGPRGEGFPVKSLGAGQVQIQFTEDAFQQFRLDRSILKGNVTIYYMGGPIVAPDAFPSTVKILSWYRTDVPSVLRILRTGDDTPAITYAEYGKGRVVLNSPHPEHVQSAVGIGRAIYQREVAWVARFDSATDRILI